MARRMGFVVAVALMGLLLSLGPRSAVAAAGPCDWEWGGVTESVPEPCLTPVDVRIVDPDTGGDAFNGFRGEFLLGAGLLVMCGAAVMVRGWGRRD